MGWRKQTRHSGEQIVGKPHAFRRLPIRAENWSFIYGGFVALACLAIVAKIL